MDQSFRKEERLKSARDIDALFEAGSGAKVYPLAIRYRQSDSLACHQVAFSVPKRRIKLAVKRNLIKRRMREAYRLNKPALPPGGTGCWQMMLIYLAPEELDYEQIERAWRKICLRLNNAG